MATWFSSLNNVGSSDTAKNNAQSFFWGLHQFITDVTSLRDPSTRWTLVSSSNWTSQTGLIFNSPGVTHSWACYSSPTTFVSAGQEWLVIDLITSNPNVYFGQCAISRHITLPTGGSTTTAPSSANQISTGIITWHYNNSAGSGTYPNFSGSIITDTAGKGGFFWLADESSIAGYSKAGIFLLPCKNLQQIAGADYPHGAVLAVVNVTRPLSSSFLYSGIIAGNLWGFNHDNTPTNTIYGCVPYNQNLSTSAPIAGYGTTNTGGVNGDSGASEIEIYNMTAGKQVRIGTLPDILATGAQLTHNTPNVVGSPTAYAHLNGNNTTSPGNNIWLPASSPF